MKKLMKNKLLFGLVCVLIVAVIAFAGVMLYLNSLDKAFDSSKPDTINIAIESGSTTDDIGRLLEEKGVIESASAFKYFSKFKGYDSKYQAGNYALSPAMKLSQIADIIMSGKTNNMTVTIPEGYTIYQIAVSYTHLPIWFWRQSILMSWSWLKIRNLRSQLWST